MRLTAAEAAAKDGVKIFTVGVGSTTGELIPVPTENGGTEFVKDASGQFVKSRLDETNAEEDRRGHGRDVSTARPAGRRIDGDLQPGACALPAARRRVAPASRLSRTVPVAIAPSVVLLRGRAFHRHTQTFGARRRGIGVEQGGPIHPAADQSSLRRLRLPG